MTKLGTLAVAKKVESRSSLGKWYHPDEGVVSAEILERRRRVAVAWNQLGMTVKETALDIGVSVSTISGDRRWLLDCWQKSVQADVVEVVARELAKLEDQEAELWDAWQNSKANYTKVFDKQAVTKAGDVEDLHETEEGSKEPNYKFMELILKCQERRARLLGLDKAVTYESAAFSFALFVEEAYEKRQDQLGRLDDSRKLTPTIELTDGGMIEK